MKMLRKVIAGIVLAQCAHLAIQHAAIGEHHFQAEAEIARIAIGEHVHATGIAGEIAADAARAFRCKREREQPVMHAPLPPARTASVAPASTVIEKSSASTAMMRVMRSSESSTSLPSAFGICPPTNPVLPDLAARWPFRLMGNRHDA
jgi:hypothetical protein